MEPGAYCQQSFAVNLLAADRPKPQYAPQLVLLYHGRSMCDLSVFEGRNWSMALSRKEDLHQHLLVLFETPQIGGCDSGEPLLYKPKAVGDFSGNEPHSRAICIPSQHVRVSSNSKHWVSSHVQHAMLVSAGRSRSGTVPCLHQHLETMAHQYIVHARNDCSPSRSYQMAPLLVSGVEWLRGTHTQTNKQAHVPHPLARTHIF
jgi:hypothetical protein